MINTDKNVRTAKISRTAWMNSDDSLKVMEALCGQKDDTGDEARFVGGCVRDAILNIKCHDIDIATTHTPETTMERLTACGIKAIPTGLSHGTVTAILETSIFEITTLRQDIKTDGRHAEVAFTDNWQLDAARRDFTINALSCSIDGTVYDYFNGMQDARDGIVRFIGIAENRIAEDYLRVLRYYRFFARYNKTPETSKTARAACKAAASSLATLSVERIQNEVLKILSTPAAADVWQMMIDDQIIENTLPLCNDVSTLRRMIKIEQQLDVQTTNSIRRLSGLLKTETEAKKTSTFLKLSNKDTKNLQLFCSPQDDIHAQSSDRDLRRAVYTYGIETTRDLLICHTARQDSKADITERYNFVTKIRLPRFPINGDDLIERGVQKGQNFGDLLRAVETWWIENDFTPKRTETLAKLDSLLS